MWYFCSCQESKCQKAKDSTRRGVIAVLLPFFPKAWHFWAWEEKQSRGTDSLWVWEHLVFITQTNLRWRRFGGDIKAGSINLYTAFRQWCSNDKELKTEMEEIKYMRWDSPTTTMAHWAAAEDRLSLLWLRKSLFCFKYTILSLSFTTGIHMRKKIGSCQFRISIFTCVQLQLFSGNKIFHPAASFIWLLSVALYLFYWPTLNSSEIIRCCHVLSIKTSACMQVSPHQTWICLFVHKCPKVLDSEDYCHQCTGLLPVSRRSWRCMPLCCCLWGGWCARTVRSWPALQWPDCPEGRCKKHKPLDNTKYAVCVCVSMAGGILAVNGFWSNTDVNSPECCSSFLTWGCSVGQRGILGYSRSGWCQCAGAALSSGRVVSVMDASGWNLGNKLATATSELALICILNNKQRPIKENWFELKMTAGNLWSLSSKNTRKKVQSHGTATHASFTKTLFHSPVNKKNSLLNHHFIQEQNIQVYSACLVSFYKGKRQSQVLNLQQSLNATRKEVRFDSRGHHRQALL